MLSPLQVTFLPLESSDCQALRLQLIEDQQGSNIYYEKRNVARLSNLLLKYETSAKSSRSRASSKSREERLLQQNFVEIPGIDLKPSHFGALREGVDRDQSPERKIFVGCTVSFTTDTVP